MHDGRMFLLVLCAEMMAAEEDWHLAAASKSCSQEFTHETDETLFLFASVT